MSMTHILVRCCNWECRNRFSHRKFSADSIRLQTVRRVWAIEFYARSTCSPAVGITFKRRQSPLAKIWLTDKKRLLKNSQESSSEKSSQSLVLSQSLLAATHVVSSLHEKLLPVQASGSPEMYR